MVRNGKITRNERKVSKTITMPFYLEKAVNDYIDSPENRKRYKRGGVSQLITEALKAKLGIE